MGNICKHRAGVRSWKTPTALSEQYVTQQTHKREHAESPRADPLLLSVQLGKCLHYDANVCIWTRTHIITVTPKNVAATKSIRLPRRKVTHGTTTLPHGILAYLFLRILLTISRTHFRD